jgi:hypothetical protein
MGGASRRGGGGGSCLGEVGSKKLIMGENRPDCRAPKHELAPRDDSYESLSHNHRRGLWPAYSGPYLAYRHGRAAPGERALVYSHHRGYRCSMLLGLALTQALVAPVKRKTEAVAKIGKLRTVFKDRLSAASLAVRRQLRIVAQASCPPQDGLAAESLWGQRASRPLIFPGAIRRARRDPAFPQAERLCYDAASGALDRRSPKGVLVPSPWGIGYDEGFFGGRLTNSTFEGT